MKTKFIGSEESPQVLLHKLLEYKKNKENNI